MNRLFDFVDEHPVWTFIFLCVILGTIADIIDSVAHAIFH